jgi:hypothetical protein
MLSLELIQTNWIAVTLSAPAITYDSCRKWPQIVGQSVAPLSEKRIHGLDASLHIHYTVGWVEF